MAIASLWRLAAGLLLATLLLQCATGEPPLERGPNTLLQSVKFVRASPAPPKGSPAAPRPSLAAVQPPRLLPNATVSPVVQNTTSTATPTATSSATPSKSASRTPTRSHTATTTPSASASAVAAVGTIYIAPQGNHTCAPCGSSGCPCATIQDGLDAIDVREEGDIAILLAPGMYTGPGNHNLTFPTNCKGDVELRSLITTPSSSMATIQCNQTVENAIVVPHNTAGGSYRVSNLRINTCGTAARVLSFGLLVRDDASVTVDAVELEGKLLLQTGAQAHVTNSVLLGASGFVTAYTLSPIQVGSGAVLDMDSCSIADVNLSSDFLEYLKSPVSLIEAANGAVNLTNCEVSRVESGGRGLVDRTVVGVYVSNGFLQMTDCQLQNNTGGPALMLVNSTAIVGGTTISGHSRSTAIMSERSALQMTDSFVDSGEALLSPSVFVFGEANDPVVFSGVSFTRNRNALGDGGALHFQSGNITIDSCLFDQINYARRGGSIFFGASPLHVLLERFSEPYEDLHDGLLADLAAAVTTEQVVAAVASSADAYVYEGSVGTVASLLVEERSAAVTAGWLQVRNSTFISSSARSSGGAIHAFGDISVDIDGCEFEGNVIAQGHGGAVNVHTSSSTITTISNTNFTSNDAVRGNGGAVSSAGWLVLDTCEWTNNYAENGAAVSASGGSLQVTGSSFLFNTAINLGGALALSVDVDAVVSFSSFGHNNAGGTGGALQMSGNATVAVNNSTFSWNSASSGAAIHTDGFSSGSFEFVSVTNSTASGSGAVVCAGYSYPSFTGVAISYNDASQEGGGVLVMEDAAPTFHSCSISFNDCSTSGGGFVAAGSAMPHLHNCLLTHNSASSGGGLLSLGSSAPSLFNTTITDNFAFGDGGGAATQDNSVLSFTGGEISHNKALSAGGGISIHGDSSPALVGTVIYNNTALSHGGGVSFHDRSTALLEACEIINNKSPVNGGGVVSLDLSNATITDSLVDGNTAGSQGGGILVATFSRLTLRSCRITDNSANSKGGGLQLANNCRPVVEHCEVAYNTATNGAGVALNDNSSPAFYNVTVHHNVAVSEAGGLLLEDNSSGTLLESDVSFNNVTAGSAGGILAGAFSNMTITATQITYNSAASGGGMLISSSSNVTLLGCQVLSNKARTDGGGLYLIEETTATVTDCLVQGNEAGNDGGGLAVSDVAAPVLTNITVALNSAHLKGGGLYIEGGSGLLLTDSDIAENTALIGGGIFAEEQAEFEISDSTVESNNARSGGGVYAMCSRSTIADVGIRNNTATYGGGIIALPCLLAEHALLLQRLEISGNNAYQGGGVFVESIENPPPDVLLPANVKYTFENCTISNNHADTGGGIYHAATAEVLLSFGPRCLLSGNVAESYGGAVFLGGGQPPTNQTVLLYNAAFEANQAYFAGSTIAFHSVPAGETAVDVELFCQNCTFADDNFSGYNGTAGYQTEDGFATTPVAIELASACPATTELVGNAFSVTLDMWDGFGTPVQGPLLEGGDWKLAAALEYDEAAPCAIANNDSLPVPPSGLLTFPDLELQGTNDNACTVSFYASEAPGQIAPTTCSVTLSGCPSGGSVAASEQAPYDTCIEDSQLLSTGEIVAISIASVLFCVCLLLAVLAAALYFRKRKEPAYHNYGKLPDFHEKRLTLEEVLTDPNIPHIAWESIERGKRIGIGGSGIVWQATMVMGDTWRKVALKQLLFGVDNIQEDILQEFLREIRIMNALRHENVVEFLGIAVSDQRELYLVTELMGNGSLFDLLTKKQQNMPWHLRLKLLKDAASGMAYLHQRSLIHRDLKSQNLLVSDQWVCKIADFGISTIKPDASRAMTCIGTPMYMAPEVITKNKYSEKADIFSFGILLVETYTCRPPYSEPKFARVNQAQARLPHIRQISLAGLRADQAQLMYQIANEGLRPSVDGLPPGLEQLVQDCWNEEPSLRPAFTEIVVRLERLRTQSLDDERLEKKGSPRSPRSPRTERLTESFKRRKASKLREEEDATAYVSFDSHEIQQLLNSEDFGPVSSSAALGSISRKPDQRSSMRNSDTQVGVKKKKAKKKRKVKSPSAEPLLGDGGGEGRSGETL